MYLTQALKRSVQLHRDETATWFQGRRRSWSTLAGRVAKFAGALRGLGVSDGERVAILALNSDRYYEYFYAVPWAGGVFVPVNIRLAPPEVAFWLNDSGSEILLIDDQFLPMLDKLEGKLETVREIIYVGDGETPEGLSNYETLLEAAEPIEDALKCDDDVAGIFYTGGTTGRSKGVMLSHRNLVFNNLNVMHTFDFRAGMRWMHACPMFHIAGGLAIFGVTQAGGGHYIVPAYTPEGCLEMIQDQEITDTLLVPTMVNMLVNHPDARGYDLSSLINLTYGASPMPEAVIIKAMDIIPDSRFFHAYGQTETAPLVSANQPEYHVLEGPNAGMFKSAGRPTVGVEVKIVNENIMLGYWQQPELTAETLRGGWMHSGDGGYMDENGFIFIVDRVKDMIISGGENVYSAEVEDAIYQHSAVVECAVIGIPSDRWGESVHAIVRCREDESVEEAALIAHCRELIAGYKCPRGIDFRDDPMPLSGAGKILKTELRKPYWAGKEKQVN